MPAAGSADGAAPRDPSRPPDPQPAGPRSGLPDGGRFRLSRLTARLNIAAGAREGRRSSRARGGRARGRRGGGGGRGGGGAGSAPPRRARPPPQRPPPPGAAWRAQCARPPDPGRPAGQARPRGREETRLAEGAPGARLADRPACDPSAPSSLPPSPRSPESRGRTGFRGSARFSGAAGGGPSRLTGRGAEPSRFCQPRRGPGPVPPWPRGSAPPLARAYPPRRSVGAGPSRRRASRGAAPGPGPRGRRAERAAPGAPSRTRRRAPRPGALSPWPEAPGGPGGILEEPLESPHTGWSGRFSIPGDS